MRPRGLLWVPVVLAMWLVGCSSLSPARPAALSSPAPLGGIDLSDPNVGGGVGYDDPPLPTSGMGEPELSGLLDEDDSPRPDGPTAAASSPSPTPAVPLAVVVTPTAGPPTATPSSSAEASQPLPTPEPSMLVEPSATPEPQATAAPGVHVVSPGETLNQIAERYGLTWLVLAELNGISNPDRIEPGQVLQLPRPEGAAAESPTDPAPTATPEPPRVHIVGPGDSLYGISQLYGVSWVEIAEANGLITANQIVVGQALKIPVSRPGPSPSFTHQVRAGESLFRIALQYGVPAAQLAEANGLQPPYVIYPGQQLLIPTGEGE